ncbi:MAG: UbiA family prenyltransferase, partial [Dokdonia donghaensis]|nr:UbiA family prenyltransferase [Dokdonia donghaensis]
MIIVMQCIIRYAIAQIEDIDITLSTLGLLFLILATVLIAAGGYVINDIYDVVADKINKAKKRIVGISVDEKQAKLIYFTLTFTGLGLGFILTNLMAHPIYFIYFLLSAGSLYLYARFIKKYAFIGNLLVSILVGLSVILVPLFELVFIAGTSS